MAWDISVMAIPAVRYNKKSPKLGLFLFSLPPVYRQAGLG